MKEAVERVARRRRQKTAEYVRQVLVEAILREGETLAEPAPTKPKRKKK